MLSFLGNLAIIIALFSLKGKAMEWLLSITGGLRIAGMGFEMLSARIGSMQEVGEDVVKAMHLQEHPEMIEIAKKIEKSEAARASVDRYWVGTFLVLLFFYTPRTYRFRPLQYRHIVAIHCPDGRYCGRSHHRFPDPDSPYPVSQDITPHRQGFVALGDQKAPRPKTVVGFAQRRSTLA
ncbi:MAG: hypothetical protein IT270_03480 [Saprospiraceae bacterium]|nr:hypothetical protein [Saprospiraceae bacterium]